MEEYVKLKQKIEQFNRRRGVEKKQRGMKEIISLRNVKRFR